MLVQELHESPLNLVHFGTWNSWVAPGLAADNVGTDRDVAFAEAVVDAVADVASAVVVAAADEVLLQIYLVSHSHFHSGAAYSDNEPGCCSFFSLPTVPAGSYSHYCDCCACCPCFGLRCPDLAAVFEYRARATETQTPWILRWNARSLGPAGDRDPVPRDFCCATQDLH